MITFKPVKRKIMIVDDDPEILRMLSLFLEDQGFTPVKATNGREAIERLHSEAPELVLLDLNLPDASGKEILKRIKEIDEDVATIVVTGYGGEKIAIDLMKAGAVDFLSKPFEMDILLKSIDDALILREARIEEKRYGGLSSLEKFFPFLAHEIRNPLHAIAGALTIIQRRVEVKDEILSKSVKIINEEVQHLTDFVQECLDFVRHPNPSYFVEGEVNELISVVMNVVSHMFEDFSEKIKVTYQLASELPKVHINYEEVKQALINIVKNSVESMPGGGALLVRSEVKTSSPASSIMITFRDEGSGIRNEDLKKVFNPFYTTKLRGSGLGLAICHRIIVERHGGKINIESEEGKGTTVEVELPVRSS